MQTPGQLPSILVINSKSEINEEVMLPRNFRTSLDVLKSDDNELPILEGLKELNIIGSSQFSEKQLELVLKQVNHPAKLYIVDLRQEWHGFLNGVPVNWYGVRNASNSGKTTTQIMHEENERLEELREKKDIQLSNIIQKDKFGQKLPEVTSVPFKVDNCSTEAKLAAKYQVDYFRIPVGDALKPNKEMVDRFVSFIQTLPKGTWLYFHCAAGRGRTSTFMAMYDMLKNANRVSFNDIVKRQYLLGGADLSKFGSENTWKYPVAIERYQFLKDFYTYAKASENGTKMTWRQYVEKNNLPY